MQGVQLGANGQMTGYALSSFADKGFMTTQATSTTAGAAGSSFGNALGGASLGLSIGQAIGDIYGAFSSAKSMEAMLKSQERIAEHNRQRGQLAAESAWRAGESQIAQLTYKAGQVKAGQRAGYGASGVRVGQGSSAEVLASTDVMKEIDVANARMNALSAAWGYKNQAMQASLQGQQAGAMSGYMKQIGAGNAVGSLLDNGTEIASRWYKYFGS